MLVDFGREHHRSLGVPVGGAADCWSLAIGNALVGNPPDAAALEMCLSGPTIVAECDIGCVVFGAPFSLSTDRQQLTPSKTFTLQAGEKLHLGDADAGMRAYLCVRGGLRSKSILGSQSSFRPLKTGATIECESHSIVSRFILPAGTWNEEPTVLRTIDGNQSDWFDLNELYDQAFEVSPTSNRIGLRLAGSAISKPDREMVSEPVCPGSVQVTRDGQGVVLGVDAQTIGGYPKIAQVISADIDKIGQLRPGDSIRFRRVTLDEADAIFLRKSEELQTWLRRLLLGRGYETDFL